MQCVQWLLEQTSAAEEMSNNASRSALLHLTIQSGQDECFRCLLAYIRDKFLELGKAAWYFVICTVRTHANICIHSFGYNLKGESRHVLY